VTNHKLKGKKVMANHIKKPNVEQKKKHDKVSQYTRLYLLQTLKVNNKIIFLEN
jgi:hypothetical protein